MTWWRDGVLYQIYPRSYADSNADGIGDIRGIIDRLDHLEWLGIDGIWLSPTMPSPNDDWGYDVADYTRGASRPGHARGPRRADRRGRQARHPRPARPRPQPHQRPPRVVPGRARQPRREAPRVLRLGGPEARRLAAQQLAELVRRPGVDARRGLRPVLPAQLPAHAARPQLVERGGAGGVRRDPALLVRPRDRRLAHRRHPRHRQGPRAARRPRGDGGRPPAHPGAREPAGVLDEPPRGPRRPAALARDRRGRRPEAHPRGGDLRARPRAADAVLRRGRGRAQPRLQLPVRARAARGRAAAGRSSRGSSRGCRRRRGPSGSAPTTTPAASPRAGRRATRRAPGSR